MPFCKQMSCVAPPLALPPDGLLLAIAQQIVDSGFDVSLLQGAWCCSVVGWPLGLKHVDDTRGPEERKVARGRKR